MPKRQNADESVRLGYIAEPLRGLAVPIAELKPDAANARKHGERNIETIRNSLGRWGQRLPIVVQKQGMIVRAGNGRLEAAKQLGWSHLAAVVVDESSVEATAFAIADNRTADLAEWDDETLASLLDTLPKDVMPDTGFSDSDLKGLLESLTPPLEAEEVETPEPPSDPVTRPGDVWTLGRHRLVCGDSTDERMWSVVDGAGEGGLCLTSPPYNLGKSASRTGNRKAAARGNAYGDYNDDRPAEEWRDMLDAACNLAMKNCEGAAINIQPLSGNKQQFWAWIASRPDLQDVAVWDKGHAAPIGEVVGVMASRYELVVLLGRSPQNRRVPLASWRGTQQSVYAAPPQRNNEYSSIHSATFPIHLPEWIMRDLCDRCQWVVDPFCGSGTTIIAAEQLGRTAYGIEISPAYCDVIVERWQNLTGEKATRDG